MVCMQIAAVTCPLLIQKAIIRCLYDFGVSVGKLRT